MSAPLLSRSWWVVVTAVAVSAAVFAAALVADGRSRTGPPAPPGDGPPAPVASWSFDDGTGVTLADGPGPALTRRPGSDWTDGRTGTALLFDGAGGYAATDGPVLDTAASFTVAAWVRLDVPGRWSTALSQDGDAYSAFFLQHSADSGRFTFSALLPGEQAVRAVALDAPRTGRWQHLVGVRDAEAGRLLLYVDGDLQDEARFDGRTPSAGPFAVGRARYRGADVDFWPGAIDGVHAYAVALTAAQVRDLHRTGR